MDTSAAPPPPPDTSQTAIKGGPNGKSALGSPTEISARLTEFMNAKKEPVGDKPKLPSQERREEKEKKEPASKGKDTEKLTTETETDTTKKEEPVKDDKRGTDGLTKEEREQVVAFKKRAEAAETRLKELEQKAQDGEATAKELAEIKKRYTEKEKEYERNEIEIAAVNIQRSAKYQETIAKPMARLTQAIEEISKACNLDADEVFGTIGNRDLVKRNSAISEYLNSMDPLTQETFKRSVNELLDLEPKAAKLMSEAREAWQSIQLEEKQRTEAEATKEKQTYLKASEIVWDEMVKEFPVLAKDEIKSYVRGKADTFDLNSAPADIKAWFVQSGYSIGKMQDAIDERDTKIKQLEESVERLTKSKGGMASGTPTPITAERGSPSGGTPGERFASWWTGNR